MDEAFASRCAACHDSGQGRLRTARNRWSQGEVAAIVADVLTQFARECGDAALARVVGGIADRLRAPVRVAVSGRPGVGRGTLAAALPGARFRITDRAADVGVLVTAETVKPEDRAVVDAWRDAGVPVLVVLNKADVAGADDRQVRRCAQVAAAPVLPAVALLADVTLDDALPPRIPSPVDQAVTRIVQ
ncbi:hypothetical protein E4P42_14930 [Mycobacterium sp. PS03-16]|uniref:hypothetical protein n=1 Tax=Mycobacterium sp. PS03-16 TaxID=2559611 RepID=UPI001074334D|nr:hypothetical protein [Mycobacterium sp. PS03-16]TFV57684.1 hypothetical protein E4P42_14930 [Mycobacterium sp. PS03-16]